ncbi:hypothetical protein GH714_037878 [Hevea brasiliensis]|uniref:HAT C-terminal dimerisation domain-containing protein n=1 Tax=Hevea brasiliensis TaxID=3981 RepID=A0A6A6LMD5_HEVBR|nr:hypothetical protein GH714_037878 [Hevea brasiliensis]
MEQRCCDGYEKLTADEWKKVEGAAKAVFEAKQPIANLYLHKLKRLCKFTQSSFGSDSFISSIAEKMLEKLDNYLKNMFMVLEMATESMTDSTSFNSGQDSSKQASYGCSDLLQEYQQFVEANNYPAKSDLDLYLEDGVLTWSQDFDTLSWWRTASPKYPVLSSIACDFLAISVSVVTGLEAYYTIEREIGPRLASLKPDLMKALTLPAE